VFNQKALEIYLSLHIVIVINLYFFIVNMLFDFQAFIEELKENPEKKQIVEKYEKLV